MRRTLPVLVLLMQVVAVSAAAQRTIVPEPLPPLPPAPDAPPSTGGFPPPPPGYGNWPPPPLDSEEFAAPSAAPSGTAPAMPPSGPGMEASGDTETGRVFCDQSVSYRLADRGSVPEQFQPFVGVWSDASWTPQLCAALIVEKVGSDGLASIIYTFGPMGSGGRGKGGVLHGTGIVRDGLLRFQNSDGSQFAFRPIFSDLEGQYTTPQGQKYQAIFKKTF